MTYHYRLYTFKNGLDETVFRAKPIHPYLPQWAISWVSARIGRLFGDLAIATSWPNDRWASRDAVMAAISDHAGIRARSTRFAQSKTLKLVIAEDVPVEVSGQ